MRSHIRERLSAVQARALPSDERLQLLEAHDSRRGSWLHSADLPVRAGSRKHGLSALCFLEAVPGWPDGQLRRSRDAPFRAVAGTAELMAVMGRTLTASLGGKLTLARDASLAVC